MGFFSKKKKVDLDELFKEKYRDLNRLVSDANSELDLEIQVSQLELADKKYDDLLKMIDQGVSYDRAHFVSMQNDLKKKIKLLKGLENED